MVRVGKRAGIAGRMGLAALLASGLALLPAPARAQDRAEEDDSSRIVVTGAREAVPSDAEQARIAARYVGELTVIEQFDALALYKPDSYCPAVVGLTPELNARIRSRMRALAAHTGVKPAGPDCQTSALVIFIDRKAPFIAEFRKTHPVYFKSLKDRHWTLPKEAGPAIAWQLAQRFDERGNPVGRNSDGVQVVESYGGGSRVHAMTSTAIAMSVVLVERGALAGLTTDQIGDYAFMRSVTTADPNRLIGSGAPTILTVLATKMGEETFGSLTAWDLAYVRSRYATDPRAYASAASARIRSEVRAAVDEEPAKAPGDGD